MRRIGSIGSSRGSPAWDSSSTPPSRTMTPGNHPLGTTLHSLDLVARLGSGRPGSRPAAQAPRSPRPSRRSGSTATCDRSWRGIVSSAMGRTTRRARRNSGWTVGRCREGRRARANGPSCPGKPDESELVRRIFAEDRRRADAAAAGQAAALGPARGRSSSNGSPRGRSTRCTGRSGSRLGRRVPNVQRPELGSQPDRRVRSGPAGSRRPAAFARGRSGHADPPGLARPDRACRPRPKRSMRSSRTRSPNAYERLVDRLLASPHYGERWARRWLDLARYADTNGYEKDRPRSIWPYRDWVIKALNADLPFDQFTIEQLAGDMLPGADASNSGSPPASTATRCSTRKAASIRSSSASTP